MATLADLKTSLIWTKNWTKTSFCILLLLAGVNLRAQHYVPFLQGQAAYLYYNPAFAGSTGFQRAAMGISMASSDFSVERLYASYDQFFPKTKAGFGVLATNIPWYFGTRNRKISYTFLEVMASPKVRLSKKTMLSFGFSVSASGKVYFRDSINSFTENGVSDKLNVNYAAGLVFNSKNFYLAYCLRNYTPLTSTLNATTNKYIITELPIFFSTIQGGMIFKTNNKFNFAPSFIYQIYHHPSMQGQNDLTLIGNFKYKKIFWAFGVGSSNLQLSVGYYGRKFRLGYSRGLSYNFDDAFYLFGTKELFFSYTFDDFNIKLFKQSKEEETEEGQDKN